MEAPDRDRVWLSLFFTQVGVLILMFILTLWGKTGFLAYCADNPGKLWIILVIYSVFALIWAFIQSFLYVLYCREYPSIWIGIITGIIGFMFFHYTYFLTCMSRLNYWIGFSLYAVLDVILACFWTKLRDAQYKLSHWFLSAGIVILSPLVLVLVWFFLHPQTPAEFQFISQKLKTDNKFPSAQKYFAAAAEKNQGKKFIHPQVEKLLAYMKIDQVMYAVLSFGAGDKDISIQKNTAEAAPQQKDADVPAVAPRPQPATKDADIIKETVTAQSKQRDKKIDRKTTAAEIPRRKEEQKSIAEKPEGDLKTDITRQKDINALQRPQPAKKVKSPVIKPLHIDLEPELKFTFAFIQPSSQSADPPSEAVSDQGTREYSPRFKHPYGMCVFQITQDQYEKVMGENPSRRLGKNAPVTDISWADANNFCIKLNKRYASALPEGYVFSLPTEAQWEYACRAGSATPFGNGAILTAEGTCPGLETIAWFSQNSNGTPHAVGQKQPNGWGLYDMHGNVFEWCYDSCQEISRVQEDVVILDPSAMRKDPDGTKHSSAGTVHIIRGGGFNDTPQYCRADSRLGYRSSANFIGFRLALVKKETR